MSDIKMGDFKAKTLSKKVSCHFLRRMKHILGDQTPQKMDHTLFFVNNFKEKNSYVSKLT